MLTVNATPDRLSSESLGRKGSSLKGAARFLATPGIISLGGGLPSSEYFPFSELSFKAPIPGHFDGPDAEEFDVAVTAGKHDLANDKSIFDIAVAFNYGQGTGAPQLLRWVVEHTELVHRPPYADWTSSLSIGSTSALDMALRMFTQPGDYILSEEYTFSTAVETAAPMGVKFAGVKIDVEGLVPASLDQVLTDWDPAKRDGARKPFILYTVPSGQNPTGATQGVARRREIYRVCQKHDVYILEDDPYYFLQMDPYVQEEEGAVAPVERTREQFLADLIPSLLSIDVDGRVMRMDSFSKVVAPGSRVGWVTASQQVVERYVKHADVSTQCPSGMSQLIMYKLLDEHWGHAGYLDWLMHIRTQYTRRRNIILSACERHLPRDVVNWAPPMAGMFHWLRIDYTKHPHYPTKSIEEIEDEIFMGNIEHGALLMKGSWFYANKEEEHDTLFFRATYAAAREDMIFEAVRRFGESVRKSFGLNTNETNGTKA